MQAAGNSAQKEIVLLKRENRKDENGEKMLFFRVFRVFPGLPGCGSVVSGLLA
jgi:hypothetical protein